MDNNWEDSEASAIKEQEEVTQKVVDKLGREHFQKLNTGTALIKLRACMFDKSTIMTHCNDLMPVLSTQVKNGKTVVFIKVDYGADWNLLSIVNEFYLHRLWKDSNLDVLAILSYAAKYSAYNNIEHLWSPMSRHLCSVILPSILEGDEKEPYKQTDIPETERKEKEGIMFDNAMSLIENQYWSGVQFNGNKITPEYKSCAAVNTPYNDYDEIHAILSGPYMTLKTNTQVMAELRSMLAHIDRKSHEIVFCKCTNPRCDHCTGNPPNASSKVWQYMKEREFKWPNPLPSVEHPGHYMTYLEIENLGTVFWNVADNGLPNSLALQRCPYCPNFLLMSDAEKKKHLSVFHHTKKRRCDQNLEERA